MTLNHKSSEPVKIKKEQRRYTHLSGKISIVLIAVISISSASYKEVFSYSSPVATESNDVTYLSAFQENKTKSENVFSLRKAVKENANTGGLKQKAFSGEIITTSLSGSVPFKTIFETKSLTSPVKSYNWNFGDGDVANGPVVSHTFKYPGTYSVTLTIEEESGLVKKDHVTVTVARSAPNPHFS